MCHNVATAGCRYEIIAGNYEQKFSIDEQSGVISVVEPLQGLSKGRAQRALAEVDPIITLQVSILSPRLVVVSDPGHCRSGRMISGSPLWTHRFLSTSSPRTCSPGMGLGSPQPSTHTDPVTPCPGWSSS